MKVLKRSLLRLNNTKNSKRYAVLFITKLASECLSIFVKCSCFSFKLVLGIGIGPTREHVPCSRVWKSCYKCNSDETFLLLHSIMVPSRPRPQNLWAHGDLLQSWIHWREDNAMRSAQSETESAVVLNIGF